jgi:4-amino-4-deoxy-L-arabinose transferase-like glycosyltransferase
MNVFGSRGNGYADSPVAFWGLMTVTFIILSENHKDENKLILLGALFAAGAALTKQTGMSMVLIYPVLLLLRDRRQPKKSIRLMIKSIGLMALMVIPWYLFKEIQIHLGIDTSEVWGNISIVRNNHSWIEIISSAQELFLNNIINPFISKNVTFILLIFLAIVSFKDKFWREICCLIIIPFWIGWMLLISYDTRNLNLIIPLLGISAGVGIRNLLQLDLVKIEGFFQLKKVQSVLQFTREVFVSIKKYFSVWKIWYLLLLIPIIFILPYWISDSRLIKHAMIKQRYIGDPYVNQQIYYYKDHYGLDGKILTPYVFLAYIPELDTYTEYYNFKNPEFFSEFNNPEIGYALFDPQWLTDDVHNYIFKLIDEKKIKIIFEFEPPSQNGYYYFVTTCHGVCK